MRIGDLLALLETVSAADGGQTTVTVQLTRPVSFAMPPGKPARASAFRFYAADPAPPPRPRPALQSTPPR